MLKMYRGIPSTFNFLQSLRSSSALSETKTDVQLSSSWNMTPATEFCITHMQGPIVGDTDAAGRVNIVLLHSTFWHRIEINSG